MTTKHLLLPHMRIQTGHADYIGSISWSPDGSKIVTGSNDHTIRICNVVTGAQIGKSFKAHNSCVNSVAWSPDGSKIASSSIDGTIRIWDFEAGDQIGLLYSGWYAQMTLSWSSDGTKVVYRPYNVTAEMIWDPVTGLQFGVHTHVLWYKDRSKCIVYDDGCQTSMKVWDSVDWVNVGDLSGFPRSAAWSPDGRKIACCVNGAGEVCIYDDPIHYRKEVGVQLNRHMVWDLAKMVVWMVG